MMKILAVLIVSILLFSYSPAIYSKNIQPNGPMDSPWPMQSHDVFHTGQSPYSTENNNGAELWKFKTHGIMENGMAIDKEGVLYFGDFDWYFYAVYPNGTLKWKNKLSGAVWAGSAPALAEDGSIYIGCMGGYDDQRNLIFQIDSLIKE